VVEGTSIIDGYKLVGCVATGNSTQIWEVVPPSGSSRFAMKLLLPRAFEDKEQIQILKGEGRVCKALNHPNLVTFHDAVFDKKHGYIVMEFLRAQNVKTQIGNDLLGLHVRIDKLIEALCLALDYMHDKGWLHCDIKPDNIVFNKSSELRLIDFSLSVRRKSFGGKLKAIQGTRTYIAPETLKRRYPTPQTDMYSLGITLFEILTGSPPFVGTSPKDLLNKHLSEVPLAVSSFNRNVTKDMDRFVKRLLAKKPKDRFKEMAEALAELRVLDVFREDVEGFAEEARVRAEEEQSQSLDEAVRSDSREDARRSEEEEQDPELALARSRERRENRIRKEKKKKTQKSQKKQKKKSAAPPAGSAAAPAAGPAYPPGVVPGQPMPPPAYPQPYPVAPMPAAVQPNMPYPVPYFQPGFVPQPYPPGVPQQYPPGVPQQLPPGQHPGHVAQPAPIAAALPVVPSGSPPAGPVAAAPVTSPPQTVQQQTVQQPAAAPVETETKTSDRSQPPGVATGPPDVPERNDDDLPLMEDLPPIL